MYFLAVATDYDGTLAHHGVVTAETVAALRRLKASGRRLILVTGRELPDLLHVCPDIGVFDYVVAENGALLYDPATQRERVLAAPPPPRFVERLREMKVEPLSVGRSIVATWEPNQAKVLEVVREMGLERQITFNKGAVMILPSGVTKSTGLLAALGALDLSAHNVVAVGDAENDHAFLSICGCSAAVSNALPVLKAVADITLTKDHGEGVIELIDALIRDDAAILPTQRHGIAIGLDDDGKSVNLEPGRGSVLIAGPSRSGKSTLATALTERMVAQHFEFCVIDPEGDYVDLDHTVCLGSPRTPPSIKDLIKLGRDSSVNLVVNTQAVPMEQRADLFSMILSGASTLRDRTGRPHWLLVDEAHEVFPSAHVVLPETGTHQNPAAILITITPRALHAEALAMVEVVIAFGVTAKDTFLQFADAIGIEPPDQCPRPAKYQAVYWRWRSGHAPRLVSITQPLQRHKRHEGKYAEGDVGMEHSFYFVTPGHQNARRARNLFEFLSDAAKVDDETWERHLRAGDYASWFRCVIRDEDLADEAVAIAEDHLAGPRASRERFRSMIYRRYAAPWQAATA